MSAHRVLGGLGFILSGLTNILVFLLVTAYLAVFTYPLSILLRGLGWISLSRRVGSGFYGLVGMAVIILGGAFFLTLLGGGDLTSLTGESLMVPVTIWAVYSFLEWVSYLRLRIFTRMFLPAMASIVGIVLIMASTVIYYGDDALILIRIGMVPLIISAFSAAIAFFSLNIEARPSQ